MPQPKKKMTNTRSGNRRSQIRLSEIALMTCSKCKSAVQPHVVCKICGYYDGKQVIDMDKKEKKVLTETHDHDHDHDHKHEAK